MKTFPLPFRIAIIVFAILAILPALYASQYILGAGDYDKSLSSEADAANREVHYLRWIILIPVACTVLTYIWACLHTGRKHAAPPNSTKHGSCDGT